MSKTAIIIPCYNEYSRLKNDLFLSFLNVHSDYTLYFVNDGSSDNTLEVLNSMRSKNNEKIKVIDNVINKGKAESVRSGMLEALKENLYDYIGFLDADLSTPFSEVTKMVAHIKTENKKAVFGSRLKRIGADIDRNLLRHFIGRFFATLISWTIKLPFYDTQCGAKIFHCSIIKISFEKPFITKWLFDVEVIMRLKLELGTKAANETIYEYPLSAWKEVKGSKLGWVDCYRIPFDLLKIYLASKN